MRAFRNLQAARYKQKNTPASKCIFAENVNDLFRRRNGFFEKWSGTSFTASLLFAAFR